ncbi:GntR family transcriptional regulator [Streptomyces sp. NPDC049949]|uniref:GntR family transcriptional regulator n=1 Tax=Streptomyces sp. NPDC049949 TaxID=3154627 RepID=UPI003432D882
MAGSARRNGRPWGALRGTGERANKLAGALRTWLDEEGLRVSDLARALTPEHFADHTLPSRHRLYDWLAGVGLTVSAAEALADACSDSYEVAARRRAAIQEIWAAPGAAGSAAATDVIAAQSRVITVQGELARLQQAYADSILARDNAQRVALVLYAMLGQTANQMSDYGRRLDALAAGSADDRQRVAELTHEIAALREQHTEAVAARIRAEQERDDAQALADEAARRIHRLTVELAAHRGGATSRPGHGGRFEREEQQLILRMPADFAYRDAALNRMREVLDEGDELLRSAREQVQPDAGAARPDVLADRLAEDSDGWDRQAPSSRSPVSMTVAALLLDRIRRGDYGSGDRLPTQAALCEEFTVSRDTVRRALRLLADSGLVTSKRGGRIRVV